MTRKKSNEKNGMDNGLAIGGELIPTRRSLLGRLRNWNDQESWKDFFDTYWRLIYGAAIKASLSDAEAQDVVQETVIAVAKNIPEFRYDPARGSFKTWLLNMTYWRITDQLRRRGSGAVNWDAAVKTPTGGSMEQASDLQGVALDDYWEEQWQQNLAEVAIERVKRCVNPKQFQAFDLYAAKGCAARSVAKQLNLSLAQVYLAKHRITRLIRQEVDTLKKGVC